MRIRLLAGGHLGATDVHELAADARRAMLLYDLAVSHDFERQSRHDGEGVFYVVVEGEARPLLDAALELLNRPEPCAPFYAETSEATSEADDPEVTHIWQEYGPGGHGVIYELEEGA